MPSHVDHRSRLSVSTFDLGQPISTLNLSQPVSTFVLVRLVSTFNLDRPFLFFCQDQPLFIINPSRALSTFDQCQPSARVGPVLTFSLNWPISTSLDLWCGMTCLDLLPKLTHLVFRPRPTSIDLWLSQLFLTFDPELAHLYLRVGSDRLNFQHGTTYVDLLPKSAYVNISSN